MQYFYGVEVANTIANKFVTFNNQGNVTPEQENNEMNNEFYNERNALKRTIRDAFHSKIHDLDHEYHIRSHCAKSVREYIDMIKAGQFDELDDKQLDEPLDGWNGWNAPAEYIRLRKHKADPEGRKAAHTKVEKEFNDISLKIDILDPKNVLPNVEAFRDVTCKKHTVH